MNFSQPIKPVILAAAVAMALGGLTPMLPMELVSSAMAADASTVSKQKQDYENRLNSVKVLTDALKKDADKPGVKDTLNKVDARSKEAESLAAAGEYDLARTILDEGYRSLTSTIAKIKSGTGPSSMAGAGMSGMADAAYVANRERELVERDITNTKALVDALKRQNAEKNGGKSAEIAKIEADIQQSSSLLAAGKVSEADKLIDDAYARAKSAVAGLQKGNAAIASPSSTAEMSGMADAAYVAKRERELVERDITSTKALLDALKRQNAEKTGGKAAEIAKLEADVQQSSSLLAAGKVSEADKLIDDTYARAKRAIASMQKASDMKTGSAALEASNQRDMAGMSGEIRKNELESRLKSVVALRDLLKRMSAENGGRGSDALARSEQLLGEASKLERSNPDKALGLADEAYDMVKGAIQKLRGG